MERKSGSTASKLQGRCYENNIMFSLVGILYVPIDKLTTHFQFHSIGTNLNEHKSFFSFLNRNLPKNYPLDNLKNDFCNSSQNGNEKHPKCVNIQGEAYTVMTISMCTEFANISIISLKGQTCTFLQFIFIVNLVIRTSPSLCNGSHILGKKRKRKYRTDNFLALFLQWHYPTGITVVRCYNPACCHSGIQIEGSSLFATRGLQLSKSLTVFFFFFSSFWLLSWERFQQQIGNPPPTHLSSISGRIIDKDSHSGMTLIAAPKPFEKWFACHFSYCCPLYDAHVSRETTRLLMQKELGGNLNAHKLVFQFFSQYLCGKNIKCKQPLHHPGFLR